MGNRKNPPLLRRSPLTDTVYVITRYTTKEDHILAREKYDVTDQFNTIMEECINERNEQRDERGK